MHHLGLILAIDGGGTKTDVVLARRVGEQLETLARVQGGPSNPAVLGVDAAAQMLQQLLDLALRDAQAEHAKIARAVIALAGAGDELLRAAMERWAAETRLAADLIVLSDAECLLAIADSLAEDEAAAVTLISGTGSSAMGVWGTKVPPVRAGGWGYLLGDEGSGYALGRAAIRSALAASELRGPATQLSSRLFVHTQTLSPRAMIGHFLSQPAPREAIAALVPLVAAVADEGDVVAASLFAQAGRDLTDLVLSVCQQLGVTGNNYCLAAAGSLLIHQPRLREQVQFGLEAAGQVPRQLYFVDDMVMAAARMAAG